MNSEERELEQLTIGTTYWEKETLHKVMQAAQLLENLRENAIRSKTFIHDTKYTQDNIQEFTEWLKINIQKENKQEKKNIGLQVKVSGVGKEGLGLIAKRDLSQGDLFLSIPYTMVLGTTYKVGPNIPRNDKIQAWESMIQSNPLLRSYPSCALALRLLSEASLSPGVSFFEKYITILPTTYDIPLYYTAADYQVLANIPTLFIPAVKLLYNTIKQYFYLKKLCNMMPTTSIIPTKVLTLPNYIWAMSTVLTRQNQIMISTKNEISIFALIPGWDLMNHEIQIHDEDLKSSEITSFSNPKDKCIDCYAFRQFLNGEQVKMFYGPRGNDELILYSGFCLTTNIFDVFEVPLLPLQNEQTDPLKKIRQILLEKEDDKIKIDGMGNIHTPSMRRRLQIMHMSKDSLAAALRARGELRDDELFNVFTETESKKARHHFHQSCKSYTEKMNQQIATLKQIESTIDEDEETKDSNVPKHTSLFRSFLEAQVKILERISHYGVRDW